MQPALDGRGLIRPRRDDEFFGEVIAGLGSKPKSIPAKWLWDERGTRLYERVCDAPEHYLARAERELLEAHAADIAQRLGPGCVVVEPAPGDTQRARVLLGSLSTPAGYVFLSDVSTDVSAGRVEAIASALRREHRELEITTVVARGAEVASLALRAALAGAASTRRVVWIGGAQIGGAAPHEALAVLRGAGELAGEDGLVLVAADLKKSKRVIEAAYEDRGGAFAAFHRNLLVRINREIGATFDVTRFTHRAPYDPIRGRVEMRLVSDVAQRVLVGGHEIALGRGEWIVSGHAYKYDVAELAALARRAGLEPVRAWTDPAQRVCLHLLAPRGGSHARA